MNYPTPPRERQMTLPSDQDASGRTLGAEELEALAAVIRSGPGTAIWDNVHIRHSSRVGEQCIIGGKTYIAYGVHIGNRVKINAMVYICNGWTGGARGGFLRSMRLAIYGPAGGSHGVMLRG